jgi:hypothetical protein
MAIELIGIAILVGCTLTELPLVSNVTGTPTEVNWGDPNTSVCGCDAYSLQVGDKYFDLDGPPRPAGPRPYGGQTVEVDYLDLASGVEALSVTVGPGLPESVTYTTSAGQRFADHRAVANASLVGLIAGLLLAVFGAAFVVRAVRRIGAPHGAVSAMLAPLSALGVIPLVGFNGLVPALTITTQISGLVWLVSGLAAIEIGLTASRERPSVYSSYSLAVVSVLGGIWIVWWIGSLISALNRAMF